MPSIITKLESGLHLQTIEKQTMAEARVHCRNSALNHAIRSGNYTIDGIWAIPIRPEHGDTIYTGSMSKNCATEYRVGSRIFTVQP